MGGRLEIRKDDFPGNFWPLPARNSILLYIKVLSFAAAASSPERAGAAQLREDPRAWELCIECRVALPAFGNVQALRESRKKNDPSVCSLKYKNDFIFRHYSVFFKKSTGSSLQTQPWEVQPRMGAGVPQPQCC